MGRHTVVSLPFRLLTVAVAFGIAFLMGKPAEAQLLGPSPYVSFANSPFSGLTFTDYFFLETFEDNLFNTPQSNMNSGDVFVKSALIKFYACPSRRAATVAASAFVGDYAGNAGVTLNAPGTSNPVATNLNGTIIMFPLSSQVSLGRMRKSWPRMSSLPLGPSMTPPSNPLAP